MLLVQLVDKMSKTHVYFDIKKKEAFVFVNMASSTEDK